MSRFLNFMVSSVRCQQTTGIRHSEEGKKLKYDIGLEVFNAMRFALYLTRNEEPATRDQRL